MEIFSTSELKKSNVRLLMKQEQIKVALIKLFSGNKIKWNNLLNEKNCRLVNIIQVDLSKNYNIAKVYINLFSYLNNNNVNIENIVKDLNKDVNVVKAYLNKALKLRKIPNIIFKIDTNNSKIKKLESILDNLTYSNNDNNINE